MDILSKQYFSIKNSTAILLINLLHGFHSPLSGWVNQMQKCWFCLCPFFFTSSLSCITQKPHGACECFTCQTMSPSTRRSEVSNYFNECNVTSEVPHTRLWTRFTMVFNGQASDACKLCGWSRYRYFYLYTYPVKFTYLPHVIAQEQLVRDDPRVSYKRISLRMADTSSVAKASDDAGLMKDDIPCAILVDSLESHTVPALKWLLLWRCIHACEAGFYLPVNEMLTISLVVFYQDGLENDARRLNCPLSMYCHVQHIDLQVFWNIIYQSPGILALTQHAHKCRRHSIVTLHHVASLQLCLHFYKNTPIRTMY